MPSRFAPGTESFVDARPRSDQQLAKPEMGALLGLDRSPLDIHPAHPGCQVDCNVVIPVERLSMDEKFVFSGPFTRKSFESGGR